MAQRNHAAEYARRNARAREAGFSGYAQQRKFLELQKEVLNPVDWEGTYGVSRSTYRYRTRQMRSYEYDRAMDFGRPANNKVEYGDVVRSYDKFTAQQWWQDWLRMRRIFRRYVKAVYGTPEWSDQREEFYKALANAAGLSGVDAGKRLAASFQENYGYVETISLIWYH